MELTIERQKRSLRMAEVVDSYRVFPRVFLTLFFSGYCWLMVQSWQWYMTLDYLAYDTAKLSALTAFPVILLTALGGMFTSMYKHYQDSGRNWETYVEKND